MKVDTTTTNGTVDADVLEIKSTVVEILEEVDPDFVQVDAFLAALDNKIAAKLAILEELATRREEYIASITLT